jgi:polar amino acid transport system permease protein
MDSSAWALLFQGAWTTAWISAVSIAFGVVLGLVIALIRLARLPFIHQYCKSYPAGHPGSVYLSVRPDLRY